MHRVSGHTTRRPFRRGSGVVLALTLLIWSGAESLAGAGTPRDVGEFDLVGTWYIFVHYRDASAASDDIEQWEDKVWTFDYRGSRLLWTEYPVVLFDDDHGRYDSLASGRSIRTSGAWQPRATQLKEIAGGLTVNPQWARSKSLRGDSTRGFRSSGSLNRDSSSVIGYSETWEIEDPAKEPVFRRIDQMSSGRSVALEGTTEYRSKAGQGSSGRLSGSFSRDGVQTGSFVMLRSGTVEFLSPTKKRHQWK